MARSKEFDTTLVLHKAMEVFGHYGYEGASLQNLLDGLGIARQSLYDTYGTKRDLFLLAVKHYASEKTTAVISYLERPGSVKESIAEIFREIVTVLKDESRCKECFILLSAIDQVPHDTEIADFFKEDMARLEEAFYTALVRAQEQGELGHREKNLRALAQYLNHARYALTQAAKLTTNPEVLDHILTVTLSTLD
ncbi:MULTISPECIES: TetR/AcrR family transcriptional regulator [Brevibacillus]|uniref:TetR/AcrR family transcriptional regulator n=1 Tax=Brevibacillus TaxID=55080 RepID=UPI000D0F05D7|nr:MULTISPECIES: TetR/AcrR family transcriptional regulator [Brevibacillus]MED1947854.1 TetR/AcrR family transcriptional regulator [Brevibacillus formosus]MED2001519.1 TetR/AcrR family transcriptional regulator [Brevibacillus formosus]MED2085089.1 TetR/AcrR family transcriptional regulator [Brevibacillus formosus]PSK05383.1 TetR/AcrR family transcriptional regulator [Brevibacillus sp. NRRL NRS-603]